MQTADTYIGFWGCDAVWTINEGVDYPRLAWQNMPGELIIKPCYAEGSGTETYPYLIYTAEQLNTIGLFPCDWDKHFRQMADIDLSEYTGTAFNIIGYKIGSDSRNDEPFKGVFEGNGKKILNFGYSSAAEQTYIGIFGFIERAKLKNLYLVDPSIYVDRGKYVGSLVGWSRYATINKCNVQGGTISGESEVGGLVGINYGMITECASTADISGNSRIGGLVGNCPYSSIGNCYSLGNVTGMTSVGGLAGLCGSQATIAHCYSAGCVQGSRLVGGLLGSAYQTRVLHSFWDIETSGLSDSDGGAGKTTAEMQTASTFVGWGPYAVWKISEGLDYPRLWWEDGPGEIISTPSFPSMQGSGTDDDPYLIYTAEQLNTIGLFPCEWDRHFRLMADIDLSDYTGTMFNCIGNYLSCPSIEYKPFSGVFDGNGHTIFNFSYSGATGNVGIFARVEGGEIKNLKLVDPNVSTEERANYVASLVGWLRSATISNCFVEGGIVSGSSAVGGLIGRSIGSTITNCIVDCVVSGESGVGGIIGDHSGTITDCCFNGEVSGTGLQVGGLVGNNYGTIRSCSASANVFGEKQVGNLAGSNRGRINGCYAIGSVLGTDDIGGFVGGNNGFIDYSYSISDVSGVLNVGGFTGQNGINFGDVIFSGNISNCYARGNVVGEENVGGFVGYNDRWGTILNCYATGSTSGVEEVGGLVGWNNQGDVINSFWDIETSVRPNSDGGMGKTTAEMQSADTFINAGWDFDDIWMICEGVDYPKLQWQDIQCEGQ